MLNDSEAFTLEEENIYTDTFYLQMDAFDMDLLDYSVRQDSFPKGKETEAVFKKNIAFVFEKIAACLEKLSEKKLLWWDCKPENVVLNLDRARTEVSEVRLLDADCHFFARYGGKEDTQFLKYANFFFAFVIFSGMFFKRLPNLRYHRGATRRLTECAERLEASALHTFLQDSKNQCRFNDRLFATMAQMDRARRKLMPKVPTQTGVLDTFWHYAKEKYTKGAKEQKKEKRARNFFYSFVRQKE